MPYVSKPMKLVTVWFTGMIYASLKPIHQWRNRWTVPNYFALALMAGFLLLDLLIRFWAFWPIGTPILLPISIATTLNVIGRPRPRASTESMNELRGS